MISTVRDRVGAATGAAFVALIIVGSSLTTAGTSSAAHPTGEQVLLEEAHRAGSTSATVGFVLEILGFVAFFGFLGYLVHVLLRTRGRSGSWFGDTAVVAGTAMLAIKLGSAAPILALHLDRSTLSPEFAQVLNDINGGAFVISWLPFAVFVAGTAAALYRAALVGKPTLYTGLVIGAGGVLLAVIGLHDVLSASPVAFLLGLLWLLVTSVRLAVKPGVGQPRAEAPASVPDTRVPVSA
jgi:hypothetical protein